MTSSKKYPLESLLICVMFHYSSFTIMHDNLCDLLLGCKALHIAVFETFGSSTDSENTNTADEKEKGKEKGKGKGKEDVDRVKNKDGTVRGILMAVCPLYVKYNR